MGTEERHYICPKSFITINEAVNPNRVLIYTITAPKLIAGAPASPVTLLKVSDGSGDSGDDECEDSHEVLGEHVEFMLDCWGFGAEFGFELLSWLELQLEVGR